MIVTCGQCGASFKVDPAKVNEGGSRVRCSNCQSVFTIYRPQNIAPAEATAVPAAGPKPPHATATPTGFDLDRFLSDLESPAPPELGEVVKKPEKRADATDFLLEDAEDRFKPYEGGEAGETGLAERRPSRYDHFEEDESFDFASPFETALEDASATKPVNPQAAPAETDYSEYFPDDGEPAGPASGDSAEITYPAAPLPRPRRKRPAQDDFDLGLSQDVSAEAALSDDLAGRKHLLDEPGDFDEAWAAGPAPASEAGPSGRALKKLVEANAPPDETDDLGLAGSVVRGRADSADQQDSPAVRVKKGLTPLWLIMGFGLIALIGLGKFWLRSEAPGPEAPAAAERAGAQPETPAGGGPALPPSITYDATADRGGLHIHLKDSKPFLRANKHAGQILIITGRAENSYPENRSFIQVKASLKDQAGNILAERLAYCGNILTEDELTELPINDILARLAIKAGQNNVNVNLPVGQSAPFMLVFDKAPASLDSYVVEALSSSPEGR